MSGYHGPSTYVIASAHDRACHVALENSKKTDGTPVISWSKTTSKSDHWEIAYLGIGKSQRDEFLIINHNSGTYLSSAENLKDGPCTGNTLSPRDDRVRWNIIPTRTDVGHYWIAPVHDKTMAMALTGANTKNGTVIKTTGRRNDDKSFAWFLILVDDADLNCPDVGKGSF